MQVPRNMAPWALGTVGLECTRAADFSSGCIHHRAILFRELLAPKRLPSWAAEGVALFVIDELGTVEEFATPVIVDRALGWDVGDDTLGLAGFRLLAVGVAAVGDHIQRSWRTHRLLCRFRHGQ